MMLMTPFRKPALPAVKPAVHAGPSGESGPVTLQLRRSEDGPATPRRSEGGFSLIFMSLFITAAAIGLIRQAGIREQQRHDCSPSGGSSFTR